MLQEERWIKEMQEFRQKLKRIERTVRRRLDKAPPGTLRISRSHGRTQFYYREEVSDRKGTYVRAADHDDLIRRLAQKAYDRKASAMISAKRKVIERFLKEYPEDDMAEVYLRMPVERRSLVHPVEETDEMYVQEWQSREYEGKGFYEETPELITDRGERVRSKSEVIIANMLLKEHVPYRYEFPIELNGLGLVYPDFTVLNVRARKEVYWEHMGMMDDPVYAERAVRRERAYWRTGIYSGDRLIITTETAHEPLDTRQVRDLIEKYLL